MMDMMEEILEILERNARASVEEIALMLDMDVKEVEAAIKKLEEDKVIVGYNTLINWITPTRRPLRRSSRSGSLAEGRVLTRWQTAYADIPRSRHVISCPAAST